VPILGADGFAAAAAEIASWPGYAPTPLRELRGLAVRLGLAALWYKDEAPRFGLGSFKALGGAYAVCRVLQLVLRDRTGREAGARDLAAGTHRHLTRDVTVTCATDGNHGRSVAWGAQLFGCRAVVFVPEAVSVGRRAAIARYGAEVRQVPGTYDDAVRRAAAEAAREGWTVVSDTSYPGYADIPRDVMHGYGVMVDEALGQCPGTPTHVFVQGGVGALAAAVCAKLWLRWGAARPVFVVVEPLAADCLWRSAEAGRPVAVEGDLATVMAGLSAGEVSELAWSVLDRGADAFLAIADDFALRAVRLLAAGGAGDAPLVAGETGAAGLAGLLAALEAAEARTALGLGDASRVLLIGSEGATDPAVWRRITGMAPDVVDTGAPK
jgi:diaminopropionate ammonia-lyase